MRTAFTVLPAFFLVIQAMSPALADDTLKAGKKVFKRCKACHAVGENPKTKSGPHLNNIFGRAAGSIEGFKYSKPMLEAGANGLVWNEETLTQFTKKPRKMIKGTRMGFSGLRKDQQISDLLIYLKSFSRDPE